LLPREERDGETVVSCLRPDPPYLAVTSVEPLKDSDLTAQADTDGGVERLRAVI
jgi:hypothetical protein